MDNSALVMCLQPCARGKQVLGSGVHLGEAGFSLIGNGHEFTKALKISCVLDFDGAIGN
jgi:hypothetical protein